MKLTRVTGVRPTYRAVALAVGLLVAFVPGQVLAKAKASGAKDRRVVCESAYERAKEHLQNAQLIEAKALLEKCVSDSCDGFLQKACTILHTQLERDVPSVVPLVMDEKGAPLALVEVRMDGALLTSKLDGLSVSVDPGKHEFSFSTDTGVFATRKVMILQGQRNRPISVLLPSASRKTRATATAVASQKAPVHKGEAAPVTVSEAVAPKAARHTSGAAASRQYE